MIEKMQDWLKWRLFTVVRDRGRGSGSRLAWAVWVLIVVFAGLSVALVALSRSAPRPDWHPWAFALGEPVSIIAFAVPGLILAARRPRNPAGWLLLLCGTGMSVDDLARAYGAYALVHDVPGGVLAVWASGWLFVLVSFPFFFLLLRFPDGRLPSARWRFAAWYTGGSAVLVLMVGAFLPGPGAYDYFPSVENPLGVPALSFVRPVIGGVTVLFIVCPFLLAVASLLFRFRGSDRVARQQLEWVALAALVATVLVGASAIWQNALGSVLVDVAMVVFSTGVVIAIVRRRLLDIDRVLSRSLLFVFLSVSLTALYAGFVSVFGLVFERSLSGAAPLLGTAVVAVALQPLRGILQRLVSRLVYGLRDDPYAVMADLGRCLEATAEADRVLPEAVHTTARALHLPYLAIQLTQEQGEALEVARYGWPTSVPACLPLIHRGRRLGALLVGPRPGEKCLTPADLRLLRELARHVATAASAVRAAEQERNRLRRDLHDGIGPKLVGIGFSVRAARASLDRAPDRTDRALAQALDGIAATQSALRQVVAGLRPTDVIVLGLIGALRNSAQQLGLRLDVKSAASLPLLPTDVETVAFRIGEGALTNVARHAQADRCQLGVTVRDSMLVLTIEDKGRGLDGAPEGAGITGMRELCAQIGATLDITTPRGGGTRIEACLPLADHSAKAGDGPASDTGDRS
ncbi:sensor histidine kinase [Streptomyces sp. NPDC051452]|uniref:sensor histidine kinase n=1 Tax=Streptomyces sp. NPDC051452 TaxID=3365654 RepID=UPI0037AC7275